MFPVLNQKSISQRVLEELRRSIIKGDLRPGERLIESTIAVEMEISRAPVREAIRMLEQEGLVINQPRHGPSVVALTAEDISPLYRVRAALEELAVRLVIENASDEALETLAQLVDAITTAAERGDANAVIDADLSFHEALCEHSQNPFLIKLYQSIGAQVRIAFALYDARYADLAELALQHRHVLESLRRRDADSAAALMQAHVIDSIDPVVSHIQEALNNQQPRADQDVDVARAD